MKNDIKKSIKVFEELSKVGFWEWDLVNDTILASDKTYEIYGTSKEIDGAYPNLNVKYGEKDAIKKIEEAEAIETEVMLLKKKMRTELIPIISAEKVVRLERIEQEFHRKILEKLKQRKDNHTPPPPRR